MRRYKDFRPTGFDACGLLADEMGTGEWFVLPCSRTRDSGCLDESNFHAALKELGGEGDDVEVHRFGHWGPGWFEIILVKPDTETARVAEDIEAALENYPVLDENDLGERESEAEARSWDSWARRDFVRTLHDEGFTNAYDWPYEAVDELWQLLKSERGFTGTEAHSDGPAFFTERNAALVTREMVARALRAYRANRKAVAA